MSSPAESAVDGKPIFEAEKIEKEFDDGKVQALRGVDFQVSEGEFVSIVGTSGSGKTTLLHMLGSLDQPTRGSLRFKGTEISELSDLSSFRAREVGFIFQSFHLLPPFTIEENVQIPMFGIPGTTQKERQERAVELLEAVGLSHRLGHMPSKLSGGERQRAAIARSMANHPSVILADEPTGNLDSENAEQIMALLGKLHREHGTTMVLVTHDMEVARYASRIIRMKDGMIISDSEVEAKQNL